jgi:hypothetical protein
MWERCKKIVWPKLVMGFLFFYVGLWLFEWLLALAGPKWEVIPAALRIPLIGGGLIGYGILRGSAFNPYMRAGYRRWLSRTPWGVEKPLPLGPLHLVWEDLLIVGLLVMAGVFDTTWFWVLTQPLVPVGVLSIIVNSIDEVGLFAFRFLLCFLLPYVALLAFASKERRDLLVPCVFLIPLTAYPFFSPLFALVVLGTIYLILLFRLRQVFRDFPQNEPDWQDDPRKRYLEEAWKSGGIGWPYRMIGPYRKAKIAPWGAALVAAVAVGWWEHALQGISIYTENLSWEQFARSIVYVSNPERHDDLFSSYTFFGFCVVVALVRLLPYFYGYLPPINFFGRIFTGRWMIPSYDQILVAPICIALFGWYGPRVLNAAGVPAPLLAASCYAFATWLALAMGPTLEQWRLTGNHRMVNVPIMVTYKKKVSASDKVEIKLFEK